MPKASLCRRGSREQLFLSSLSFPWHGYRAGVDGSLGTTSPITSADVSDASLGLGV
jgi:hypothetical protein